MTTAELQNQLEQAHSTVRRLQKAAATPSGDYDADLATETQLVGAERLVERLERQLSEALEREEADRKEQERAANLTRLEEIEALHAVGCAELDGVVDDAARQLEVTLVKVRERRANLNRLSSERDALFYRVHGRHPSSPERLSRSGLIPGDVQPLHERAQLYGNAALALYTALGDAGESPYNLALVLASVQGTNAHPSDARPSPMPTLDPAAEGLAPGQRLARQRRSLLAG